MVGLKSCEKTPFPRFDRATRKLLAREYRWGQSGQGRSGRGGGREREQQGRGQSGQGRSGRGGGREREQQGRGQSGQGRAGRGGGREREQQGQGEAGGGPQREEQQGESGSEDGESEVVDLEIKIFFIFWYLGWL